VISFFEQQFIINCFPLLHHPNHRHLPIPIHSRPNFYFDLFSKSAAAKAVVAAVVILFASLFQLFLDHILWFLLFSKVPMPLDLLFKYFKSRLFLLPHFIYLLL
jgi:hypothetical protein